ncbi:MAG: hypothetical protein CO182_04690, partial [Lysobacterales bacterium CG_4_9_14_3_um_filter_62_6]
VGSWPGRSASAGFSTGKRRHDRCRHTRRRAARSGCPGAAFGGAATAPVGACNRHNTGDRWRAFIADIEAASGGCFANGNDASRQRRRASGRSR